MKKHWRFVSLDLSLLAMSQLPALAVETWFQTYDADHDSRWTYPEFAEAHQQWVNVHPNEMTITKKELHQQFNTLDTGRNGYVTVEQVRTFHDW